MINRQANVTLTIRHCRHLCNMIELTETILSEEDNAHVFECVYSHSGIIPKLSQSQIRHCRVSRAPDESRCPHTRNDTIEVMEKVEGKQNKTGNSNNCQDTGQRYRKLGISRSPKDKRKQDKAVDFTVYLPPVRAPGGKKLKGKRKKNRLKDSPRNETSDFSDKVLKLPPIDPNAQSTIESSASPRKSTVTTRRINDDGDNDGLERNSSKNQKGIFAFRQQSCGKVMFSVVSVSHSVCPQERSHVTAIHLSQP